MGWMARHPTNSVKALQVQGSEIFCLTISAIHRSAVAHSDQHLRLTSSQRTGTRSAAETFCAMHFTNQRSSSSSSSSSSLKLNSKHWPKPGETSTGLRCEGVLVLYAGSPHQYPQTLMLYVKKVKASHTRYQALGPELIPVYRQSACRWP